jgi:hypothetical protein
METKLDSVEEVTEVAEVEVHRTVDDKPVKDRKSKKHDKDCNKAGRVSMAPPSLAQPSKRACYDIADSAPQEGIPGRNKSCSATFPGKNQRPIPVRSNDHREYGDDGTYNGAYNGTYDDTCEVSWKSSKDFCEPRRRFTSYYEGRHFEDNASIHYGHHPLSPYTSNLNVALRC